MKKMTRPLLFRLLAIHAALLNGKYPNAAQLAEQLEVTSRTVHRALDCLRDDLNAPIAWDSRKKGYYYVDQSYRLPFIELSEGDALGVFLALNLLPIYRGTPYEAPLRFLLDKLTNLLPSTVNMETQELCTALSLGVEVLRGETNLVSLNLSLLSNAIAQRRSVGIKYHTMSRDEVTERIINPYHIHFVEGAWYVIGYCHLRAQYRTFAVDRIKECNIVDQPFDIPADFSIEEYLGDCFILERGEPREVCIWFHANQARWIRERVWHQSQVLEENPDRSIILRLRVGGLGEIKRWVLGFGSGAKVLQPPELCQELKKELDSMSHLYE
ncbi:MAG: transcriptional regulator [Firmicutes bacterium]|nr:transcriptional regulator [Bacillota bacterium]